MMVAKPDKYEALDREDKREIKKGIGNYVMHSFYFLRLPKDTSHWMTLNGEEMNPAELVIVELCWAEGIVSQLVSQ